MKPTDVPVKTSAGTRELSQRQHKLSPRARSLLIVIHGTETVAELTTTLHALGDIGAALDQLYGLGLIELRGAAAANAPVYASEEAQPLLLQAKQFINESAVAVLGLRAFLFTLKLEHCYTEAEIRGILPEYRRVVGKAKGETFADAMVRRVESLLARATQTAPRSLI
jgi:hypothetical protein